MNQKKNTQTSKYLTKSVRRLRDVMMRRMTYFGHITRQDSSKKQILEVMIEDKRKPGRAPMKYTET